ncbi:MAG: RNA-guided pseudouridylation complex pseudouridine synthase subunit Cbf5 [Candidatus Micrarchaeia archaeon]
MKNAMLDNRVIIIDKPPGHTSHEITTFVKKITGVSRSGHAGTLDPEVSGVLPVALGRATKLLRYLSAREKTYVGIMKFRIPQSRESIESLFARFRGEITQTPPKISAVRKVPRRRRIYSLKLLEVHGRLALFETTVDAGTYIRTLCEDMGKECGGARMEELRRTAVGRIGEGSASTMQELVDAIWLGRERGDSSLILSMAREPESLIELPKVFLRDSSVRSIATGAQVMVPAIESIGDVRTGDRVAIFCGKRFIGVGVMQIAGSDLQSMKRGLAIRIERMHLSD